uniref:Glycosyltransferase n=1 Tax=Streptococcus suis TaxID=1307 RepID=A0A0F6UWF5_STRSU|nr:glycosyltransferase [Streptococcus suis]
MEKYSVLISLYMKERPEYLRLAVQSMLDQTVQPDEIIIVKDGQITTELQSVLNEFQSKYPELFNIVGYDEQHGLGVALNYGLKHSKNELVARMDTDDISKPDRCEKQLRKFELYPELAIVGAWVDEFTTSPDKVQSTRVVPTDSDSIYNFAKKRSAFNHPVVMYRKSAVLKQGGYADLRRNQDVDLFGRMLFAGEKAENIGESLLWFRSNDDLAKRRKSWTNTWSYINTIKRFWEMGYSSFGDLAIITMAQIGMYLMPVKLQHWVYKKFLRK